MSMLLAPLCALVLAQSSTAPTAPAAAAAADRKAVRLAVYELKVDGVDERLGRVVTDAVVLELRKLKRVSVVSMEEVRAMLDLEAQKQLLGCADDSCLAEIADSLGVDGVVIGSLARLGDEHVFGLRRIDQREAKALGQVAQRLKAEDGEEFLAMVGPSVEELFPDHPLREGQTRGVAKELALRLNPPPLPPWAFWSTVAVASGLTLATGASVAVNVVLLQQVSQRQDEAKTTPVSALELKSLREQNDLAAWVTVGLAGTAVAAGATAGAMMAFTDWTGAAE